MYISILEVGGGSISTPTISMLKEAEVPGLKGHPFREKEELHVVALQHPKNYLVFGV